MGLMFGLVGFIIALGASGRAARIEKELAELKRAVEKLTNGK